MAIPEITQRHIAEWSFAWWRREHGSTLLRYGMLEDFAEIDEQMLGYADGASLDAPSALQSLIGSMDPDADDFQADVVAGMLLGHRCGRSQAFDDWLSSLPDTTIAYEAYRLLMRWLGKSHASDLPAWLATVNAGEEIDHKLNADTERVAQALASHQTSDLRFIDAFGEVQGHYQPDCLGLDCPPDDDDPGRICSYILAHPENAQTELQSIIDSSRDPAVAFLVAGISGDLALIPWLIQCAEQPQLTFLAVDAFRRITGFDAVGSMELDACDADSFDKHELDSIRAFINGWHAKHGEALGTGYRFLGTMCNKHDIANVLRYGNQADREIAAMWAAIKSNDVVFPARSRVSIQRLVLDHLFPEPQETL